MRAIPSIVMVELVPAHDGDARELGVSRLSGVTGFAREHAEINPDLLEGIDVLAAGIGPKYQVRIRCAVQPSTHSCSNNSKWSGRT